MAADSRVDAALSRAFLVSLAGPPSAPAGATHLAALQAVRASLNLLLYSHELTWQLRSLRARAAWRR